MRAWRHTYGLPTVLTNCSNNYGPYHFPEKLIPLMILNALEGKPLPVYGAGENVRDWLFVEDHAEALLAWCEQGRPGESYNIGGAASAAIIDVVEAICDLVDELAPGRRQGSRRELIRFVARPPRTRSALRDRRVEDRARTRLAAAPDFESGLRKTVQWYLDNELVARHPLRRLSRRAARRRGLTEGGRRAGSKTPQSPG